MISRRRLIELGSATALAAGSLTGAARAQAWPNRHVRLVVPFPPGGGADAIARIVAARLSEVWGQQVVIENRGGASGNLAAETVARAAPDGYTLFLAGDFHAVNLFLYPKLSYDPIADFAPVSLVVFYPCAMVVPNSSPARSISEFVAHAKSSKTKLTFASPGHGTASHLAVELLKRVTGIELTIVPYRGAAPAIQDLIPGRVDLFVNNLAPLIPLGQQGQLRILAVTTAKRSPAAPDVPTLAESGVSGFDVAGWYAFFVPAKTPTEIVRKMHTDTAAVLAEPAIKTKLEQLGLFVVGSSPDELGRLVKADMEKWEPVIKEAGISIRE